VPPKARQAETEARSKVVGIGANDGGGKSGIGGHDYVRRAQIFDALIEVREISLPAITILRSDGTNIESALNFFVRRLHQLIAQTEVNVSGGRHLQSPVCTSSNSKSNGTDRRRPTGAASCWASRQEIAIDSPVKRALNVRRPRMSP